MPRRNDSTEKRVPRRPSATTPEARENQLIALAVDLAEEQLSNGTASVPVITHYLKLATTREALEREKLAQENELLRARTESLAAAKNVERLYEEAVAAMRTYGGIDDAPELL